MRTLAEIRRDFPGADDNGLSSDAVARMPGVSAPTG